EVLHEYHADRPFPTASMVKMMTLLVVMDHVEAGDVAWDRPIEVSARSSRVGGSQVYLKEGEVFPLSELVAAVMIKSANDAAYLLAEAVGGSVEAFVAEMHEKGRELRLQNSRFHTPHGLPPEKPGQHDDVMSARDLATVGARVLRNPRLRELAATESRPFRDGDFVLRSSNHLLRRWDEAIGIKTGWTSTADFCLTAAARRHGVELVAVVQGAQRKEDSFDSARRLLEEGFSRYRLVTLAEAGDRLPEPAAVAGGERPSVPVVALEPARILVREGTPVPARPVVLSRRPQAPVEAGQPVGFAVYRCGLRLARVEVAAAEPVAPRPWWRGLWQRFVSLVAGLTLGVC
ncbi:MAG TPA: D-alanyl-D-alanine carboxypeptidase family protein, partial [Thermoanaerobaculia bacterium]|nr:D-alanyl-D-alanine carboxypeptidase family protein [Thermoanaerobaculia bacterium]